MCGSYPTASALQPLRSKGDFHVGTTVYPQMRYPLLQAFVDNRTILVKIAARITGCRSRAEDVVQDAFFRLQSAPQITSSFKAQLSYLFQIVRNLAIDHYRKQALEQKYSGPEEEGLNVVIQGASPETSHINYATLEHIADALTELPKRTATPSRCTACTACRRRTSPKELGVSPTPWSTS